MRDRLIRSFDQKRLPADDDRLYAQFQMVSASVFNYLPQIVYERHQLIFNNILLHKKLSILEQDHLDVLDCVDIESCSSEIMQLLRKQPAVICTFHLGSYRVLNLLLLKERIPFSLVVGKEVMEQEGNHFNEVFKRVSKKLDVACPDLINAEEPRSVLNMLSALKHGRSIVLYIDGNTGAGAGTSKNENSCVIDFLGQQIYTRKGIAWMAHHAGVPIVVSVSVRRGWEAIGTKFFDPIYPELKDGNEFAQHTTQKIYDMVSPLISENPEQWEAWLYLHKSARIIHTHAAMNSVKKRSNVGEKAVFNSALFGKFKIDGTPFLLQKQGYEFYEISDSIYDALEACTDRPAAKEIFGESLFEQLWEKAVLIRAPG